MPVEYIAFAVGVMGMVALVCAVLAGLAVLLWKSSRPSEGRKKRLESRRKRLSERANAFANQIGGSFEGARLWVSADPDGEQTPDSDRLFVFSGAQSPSLVPDPRGYWTEFSWTLDLPCSNLHVLSRSSLRFDVQPRGFYRPGEVDLLTRNSPLFNRVSKAEFQVGEGEFDSQFLITGKRASGLELLQPELRQAILEAYSASANLPFVLSIRNKKPIGDNRGRTVVRLRFPKQTYTSVYNARSDQIHTLQGYIESARAVYHALSERLWRPWRKAAADHGLTLDEEKVELSGTVEGLFVQVTRGDNLTHAFEVRIAVRGPKGLHLVHADRAPTQGGQIAVSNPLVSRMLSIQGDDTSSIEAMFGDSEWIDNLLPLVHGYEGSEVTESGVTVRVTEYFPDLSRVIQQAVVVAKGLEKHAPRLPKEVIVHQSDSEEAPAKALEQGSD